MAELSAQIRRVIGVLVDRRGYVTAVVVGDTKRLYLPDIGRARAGATRLRGLRLVRTTFAEELVSRDDLTDLSKLRLDLVACVRVVNERAAEVGWAHLVPENPDGEKWSVQQARHVSELDLPFEDFIRELEAEFEVKADRTVATDGDAAMIVYVRTREDYQHEARLAELYELCRTAGVRVVESYVQSRQRLDPRFAVGKGALEEVELRALQLGAEILVFGQDLTPAQTRGVADATNLRVVDRTQLILDIFAQRAQTRVGKLQVELAQLAYRMPRLSGRGTAMSRLAGGIGGRGPGESRLEIDRRRARDRVRGLEKEIERLGAGRELRRRGRREAGLPVVSIVGYTNAGKSTLLNTLTNATVLSEDKLFATLDPTSRRLRFPEEREIILTDTVGFIRDLPEELKESFRSTLEELAEADLLLHLVDGSDPSWEDHVRSTEQILSDLELDDTPRLLVFNKSDRLEAADRVERERHGEAVFISALRREQTRPLIERLDRWLVEHGRGDVVPEAASASDDPDGDADDADVDTDLE